MDKDRADISRQNGAHSRGPVTQAGKSRSSQNARKHGVLAKDIILPNESPEEWEALVSDLGRELGAEGLIEWQYVERMAESIWRQRRLARAERASICVSVGLAVPIEPYRVAAAMGHPDPSKMTKQEADLRFVEFSLELASLPGKAEQIGRYQVSLENSFAKALKGFREAQEYRLRSLPAANDPDDGIAEGEFTEIKP